MQENSVNETQDNIINTIDEFEQAVSDLNGLFSRLKTSKVRHENQLRLKAQ